MLLSINVLRSYEDHRLYYSAFFQSRHCSQQINKDLPAGLDLSVEHLTAAWEVMGSIPKARPKLRILMRIKVLPLSNNGCGEVGEGRCGEHFPLGRGNWAK